MMPFGAEALSSFAEEDQVQRLARHMAVIMQGISIQARDGVATSDLLEVVDDVVARLAGRFPSRDAE
jgi:hypothetical protein